MHTNAYITFENVTNRVCVFGHESCFFFGFVGNDPNKTSAFMQNNKQVITIKAKVYKPETFALVDPPEVMRLEPCLVGETMSARPLGEARVLLRNTTARRRIFVIEGVGFVFLVKMLLIEQLCGGHDCVHSRKSTVCGTAYVTGMR